MIYLWTDTRVERKSTSNLWCNVVHQKCVCDPSCYSRWTNHQILALNYVFGLVCRHNHIHYRYNTTFLRDHLALLQNGSATSGKKIKRADDLKYYPLTINPAAKSVLYKAH